MAESADDGSDGSSTFGTLLAGSGIVALGLVFHLGLGFVGRLIVARFLGRVDYGAVSLGVTLMTTASILVVIGVDNGVGRYLPRFDDPARRRGVLVSAYQVVLPVAVLVGLAVAALADPIATHAFTDPAVAPVLRVFGLAIPFAAFVRLTVGSVRGMQQALPRVLIDNVAVPLTRFALIAVAVLASLGAVGVAWAYAGAYALATAAGVYYLARETPILAGVEAVTMRRELLVFSAPLMVTAGMSVILSNLDTFMLGYFASTGDVGVYNVAYPLARLLTVTLTAFGFLFMPVISELHSEGRHDEIARTYQVVSKWLVLASLPLVLVLVTFPRVVIGSTFGPEYVSGGLALAVLAVGFFVHASVGPAGNTLMAFGRTRRLMYANVLAAGANAALNLYLIPRYGILGAAIATTAGYGLLNGLFLAWLYRELGTHPFQAAMVRPALASVGLWAGLALAISSVTSVGLLALLAVIGLFLPLFAVVVLRFGGVEEEEFDLLRSVESRLPVDLVRVRAIARRLAG